MVGRQTGAAGKPPADHRAGRRDRVCFFNHFARGSGTTTPRQRAVVICGAESRDEAAAAARERFAEIEGVADWHLHATTIDRD
ncbi:MAG TPA: hypothetical protein VMF86_18700 [Stellaceae bacterium]|nr:hypothetical protein [Stellaceae bacterium]